MGDQVSASCKWARRYLPPATGRGRVREQFDGNGKFTTAADPGNFTRGGAGIISGGTVTDPTKLTGHKYSIDFQVTGTGTDAKTTYTVTDVTLGQTIPNPAVPVAYKSGDAINFDGQQVNVAGKPADLDKFTLEPSSKESIFTTITNLIGALGQPATGDAGQARLTASLNTAHDLLDTAYDNVLSVRAEVGSRLKELDTLDSAAMTSTSSIHHPVGLQAWTGESHFHLQPATDHPAGGAKIVHLDLGLSLFTTSANNGHRQDDRKPGQGGHLRPGFFCVRNLVIGKICRQTVQSTCISVIVGPLIHFRSHAHPTRRPLQVCNWPANCAS